MTVEDNTFDFLVRDRLKKECEERGISLSGDPTKDQLMLDMITYCSRGNKEEAVCNLTATKEFIVGFQHVQRRLPGGWWWADPNGWEFMFEFWKKSFIKIKVLVQKQEPLPSPAYSEVISREYGRFLQEHNFPNVDTFKAEARGAIASLKNDSENFNNIYKDCELEP